MKRRYVHYMLNLFSFTLLSFALYLNFVKQEPQEATVAPAAVPTKPLAITDDKTAHIQHEGPVVVLK